MPGKLAAAAVLGDERGEKAAGAKRSLVALTRAAWRLRAVRWEGAYCSLVWRWALVVLPQGSGVSAARVSVRCV
jgi:hypothetical protein